MRTFIAIPAQDSIDTMFARSLVNLQLEGETAINFSESSLVYDSRNKLTLAAIASKADYILWLDSDMTFEPDMLQRMYKDIEKGADMVCGLFFARRPPYQPCIYKTIRQGLEPSDNVSERYNDYPEDELFEVDACGMAAVLMKCEVAKAVVEKNNAAFDPIRGYGEDISFCIRAKKLGYKIFCDPTIKVGHMGKFAITEGVYKQYKEIEK